MRRKSRRVGFTLVELLVVITIIGILIALLLPAVQAAREAARRMQCGNNLKQLALAVLSYESACNRFPAGATVWKLPPADCTNTWMVRVMPYMELNGIYDQWSFKDGYSDSPINVPLMEIQIPAFCCPSDTAATKVFSTTKHTRSNYVACFSPSGKMVEPDITFPDVNKPYDTCNQSPATNPSAGENPRRRALFNMNVFRDISAVTDGLSSTIAMSEAVAGEDLRCCWWHSWGMQYTHHRTPNTSIPDDMFPGGSPPGSYCGSTPDAPCTPSACGQSDLDCAARSKHPGGVMAARIDGSVDFYSNDIALGIWQALGSIDGGELP